MASFFMNKWQHFENVKIPIVDHSTLEIIYTGSQLFLAYIKKD